MDPLLVDLYSEDVNGTPDIAKLAASGYPWIGVSLKVSQGTYYNSGEWLKKYWPIAAAQPGIGQTWFRQGYQYLDLTGRSSAKRQWDYFEAAVVAAGGWKIGDLPVGVDVEQASNPTLPGAQLIIDYVSEFAECCLAATGQKPICYGGSYLRDNGVKDHMGCQAPWIAYYASTLPPYEYASIGYPDVRSVWAWQYAGTEVYSGPSGYPRVSPCGHTDISAIIIDGGGDNAMEWLRTHTITPVERL